MLANTKARGLDKLGVPVPLIGLMPMAGVGKELASNSVVVVLG